MSKFVDTGLAGTWIESFYNSKMTVQVTDFEPNPSPDSSNPSANASTSTSSVDRSKYSGSIRGTYKDGAGTIEGLVLHTRKSAHGVWREGENEGLFQFDILEDGLIFCGPFFHDGTYMGTW